MSDAQANAAVLAIGLRREQVLFAGLTMPAALTILVVVFLPIFWLSSLSFLDRAGEPTLENYRRLRGDIYVGAFLVTFQISAAVTAICVLLGYPLAYWLSRQRQAVANLLLICMLLRFWTAVLVRAAIGLGSSPTGAFWRVFVPMSLPGLFAGVVLVFVLSLGFYVTPALLGGGRVQMIAQRIESTITIFSNWGAASALGVVLLAMALALVALLHRAFGRDRLFVR